MHKEHKRNLLIAASYKNKERVIKRALSCLIGAMLLVGTALAAAPAPPPISPAQIAFYQSSPEVERVRFLIKLSKSGMHELAAELLQRFPLQGPLAANRTLYIEGLILEHRHDLTGAARKFRAALADDPKLTLVRSELVQVLVALDENDSAKHHLQLLEADAPSEMQTAGIRSFIDKINQSHPYWVTGFISIAPSTNINNGSTHDTVYGNAFDGKGNIGQGSKAQSGFGFQAGLSAGYSKKLGNRIQAVIAASVSTNLYGDSQYDATSTSESGELRYLLENGFISLGGVASQGIDPAQRLLTYNSYGPRVAINYQVSQRNLFKASVVDEYRDYMNSSVQNGMALSVDASVTHAIDSSMNFTPFGGYEKIDAGLPWLAYQRFYGGLNLYKEMPMGVTLDINGQVHFINFDGDNPITGNTRQDQRYVASATLTKRDLNLLGFAPSLTYTYTLNKSNSAIWDYDSHAFNFSLTKDF
jgi:hypothetical protein